MRITLFDNHDSFTWNLAHDLERLGTKVTVVRDGDWTEECWALTDAMVLSPGPGLPEEHPQLMEVVAGAVSRRIPLLGVCLGMQALSLHFGGTLRNLSEPLHGRRSQMRLDAVPKGAGPLSAMWDGLEGQMEVGHYHSWVVDEEHLPDDLHVNARNSAGLPMAFFHASLPVAGVQFHPESVLTPKGRDMLKGWLVSAQRCLAISASNVSLNFS